MCSELLTTLRFLADSLPHHSSTRLAALLVEAREWMNLETRRLLGIRIGPCRSRWKWSSAESFHLTLPMVCVSWVSVTLLLAWYQYMFNRKIFLKVVTNMSNFTVQSFNCIPNIINLSCTYLWQSSQQPSVTWAEFSPGGASCTPACLGRWRFMFPFWLGVSSLIAGLWIPAHARREAAEAKFTLSASR